MSDQRLNGWNKQNQFLPLRTIGNLREASVKQDYMPTLASQKQQGVNFTVRLLK